MELVVLCQCLFWCVFVMVSERWSVDHLKPVCVHCGCEGTGRTLNVSQTIVILSVTNVEVKTM